MTRRSNAQQRVGLGRLPRSQGPRAATASYPVHYLAPRRLLRNHRLPLPSYASIECICAASVAWCVYTAVEPTVALVDVWIYEGGIGTVQCPAALVSPSTIAPLCYMKSRFTTSWKEPRTPTPVSTAIAVTCASPVPPPTSRPFTRTTISIP